MGKSNDGWIDLDISGTPSGASASGGSGDWVDLDLNAAPEPRSLLKEVPTQLYAGAAIDLLKQIGQAMQWMSEPGHTMYDQGKRLQDWAAEYEAESPSLAPQVEGRGLIGRALSTGARAMAPSTAIMVPAALGVAAAPVLGVAAGTGAAVGAAAGAFGLFGAAQAQDTYDKLLKAGIPDNEARQAGWINLMIEGGGETAADISGLKLFGVLGKAFTKGASPVANAIQGATDAAVLKPFLKQLPKTAAIESSTEFGQNFGEAWIEQKYGAPPEAGASPFQQGVQGAEAALGMTILLAPFGLAGFAQRAKRNEKVATALEDPSQPVADRIAAARIMYAEIADVDKDAAAAWAQNSSIAITADAPIVLDETSAQPGEFAGMTPNEVQGELARRRMPSIAETGADEEAKTAAGVQSIDAAQDPDAAIKATMDAASQPIGPDIGGLITSGTFTPEQERELIAGGRNEQADGQIAQAEQEASDIAEMPSRVPWTAPPDTGTGKTAMQLAFEQADAKRTAEIRGLINTPEIGGQNAETVRSDQGQIGEGGTSGQPGVQPSAVEGGGDLQQPASQPANVGSAPGWSAEAQAQGARPADQPVVIPTTPAEAQALTNDHLAAARNLTRSEESRALIDAEMQRRAQAPAEVSRGTSEIFAHNYPAPGDETDPVRVTARALRTGDPDAISRAAADMAKLAPRGAQLIPVPGAGGTTEANVKLAEAIAQATGGQVADILTGPARARQYEAKKAGQPLSADQIGTALKPGAAVPQNAVLVDNVIGTGATLAAARRALGRAVPVVAYAKETRQHGAPVPKMPEKPTGPVLQNRDRSTAASVTQMAQIAANPDPARLSFSRDFLSGAPTVIKDKTSIPDDQLGAKERIITAAGREIPVQYAVVEAKRLLPSHAVDGIPNPGYDTGAPGKLRVVAGNGRAAGIQAAYRRGTTLRYIDGIIKDAGLHGVPAEAINGMREPVLVRVMSDQDVTPNLGDETNIAAGAELSPVEKAANDARRIDIGGIQFGDDGEITPAAVTQFVQAMPETERAGLIDERGQPTRQAYDRLTNAAFMEAYADPELVSLQSQATDTEARTVMTAMVRAAPAMARLAGAGDLDIRPLVVEAAKAVVNAKRAGIAVSKFAAQSDMTLPDESRAALKFFADNIRSAAKIGEGLFRAATIAGEQAGLPASDMFGNVPRMSRAQILEKLQNDTQGQENLGEQAGAGAAGQHAGGQAANAERPASGGAAAQVGPGAEQASRTYNPNQRGLELEPPSPAERPSLALAGETPAELKARGEAEAAAARAKAAEEKAAKEAADKARLEAEAKARNQIGAANFELTAPAAGGRAAMKAASAKAAMDQLAGQADIFSQPASALSAPDLLRAAAAKMEEAPEPKTQAAAGQNLVGQMVKFKIAAPSGPTTAVGRVLSVRQDGKLDIRLQQGGYVQIDPADVTPFETTAKTISDFGEKIAGARKDYAAKLAEAKSVDVATMPLSQSWPEPDYKKLIDGGVNPWAAAFMHAARDEIPTKPSQSWKLQRWVAQVEQLRDVALGLADGKYSVDRAKELLAASKALKPVADRLNLYQEVGHSKSLKGVRISEGVYSMYNRVAYDPPKVIWSVEAAPAKTAMSRWPKMLASGDTREQAIANFKKAWLETTPEQDATKAVDFQIYSKTGSKEIFIGKKIGKNVAELKGGFANAKEARAWKDANQAELVKMLERYKDVPYERKETNSPRVGIDHRNGANITPEQFTEAFGFRGVQFGNYVEGDLRQRDLNETYDALMDLSGVLGVPSKALSLNGELGLAFGARGTGGKRAPSAHYEPGQVVINLTKARGAGSLAHEWFHGVDNYFSRAAGAGSQYLTETQAIKEGVRTEMVDAFKKVMQAIKESGLSTRSRRLDETRSKPYWSTKLEMAARSFEAYIVAKLQDQGASNDYLANIVSEDYWKAATALGIEKDNTFPYPVEAEMPTVRAAFDHFFQTIETRATEKGMALFSRIDKPWYFSALSRAIDGIGMKSAPASGWKSYIQGLVNKGTVKQAEVEWTGINDWLATQESKVTKEQVQAFMEQGGVKVTEESYSTDAGVTEMEDGTWSVLDGNSKVIKAGFENEEAAQDYMIRHGSTKFADYQLPGSVPGSYRELVLTLPPVADRAFDPSKVEIKRNRVSTTQGTATLYYDGEKFAGPYMDETGTPSNNWMHPESYWIDAARKIWEKGITTPDGRQQVAAKSGGFESTHFPNAGNYLAHTRVNDRILPDGRKVLFVEEIQSDRAQKGRQEGFAGAPLFDVEGPTGVLSARAVDRAEAERVLAEEKRQFPDLDYRIIESKHKAPGIATAPFVTKTDSWTALVIKRLLRYAAEGDYAALAWTRGDQQVERYTSALRKAVDVIEWKKTQEGVQIVGYKGGEVGPESARLRELERRDAEGIEMSPAVTRELARLRERYQQRIRERTKVVDTTEKETALSDAIGKSMAERIINDPNQTGTIEGDGITVSSTGMASYYERIVPSVANEISKKLGGSKVEIIDMSAPRFEVKRDQLTGLWYYVDDAGAGESNFKTREAAQAAADKDNLAETTGIGKQQGLVITPAMREAVMSGQALFKQTGPESANSTMAAAIRSALAPAIARTKIKVNVWNTADEAAAATGVAIPATARAMYHQDEIHLFAGSLDTQLDAEIAFWHEALHAGLNHLFGTASREYEQALTKLASQNRNIRMNAQMWRGLYGVEAMERAQSYGLSEELAKRYVILQSYDEALADLSGANATIAGIKPFLAAVQKFLRSIGLNTLADAMEGKTDAEALALIARARNAVMIDGAHVDVDAMSPAFRESQTGQTQTPEFKAWFGDSRVVDETGQPQVYYHGTANDITAFRPKQAGAIFLSPDPATADDFAQRSENYKRGHNIADETGQNVLPVYVKAENPFDPDSATHMRELRAALGETWEGPDFGNSVGDVAAGRWTALENPVVQAYIKAHHDGFYVYEGGVKNLAVFSPTQVKSAIGNVGTFDAANPDIRFSQPAQRVFQAVQSSPKVTAALQGLMKSPVSLGVFNAFNSQYHKAEMLARKGITGFRDVFNETQAFLNDINALAVRAEQRAPAIFRELTGMAPKHIFDYFQGAAKESDIAAIGPWLNHGTLYGGGNPLEGRVWTDDQLRGKFAGIGTKNPGLEPLTEKQVELYHQARAAIDQSLEDNAKSIIFRHVNKQGVVFDKDMSLADVAEDVRQQLDAKIEEATVALEHAQDQDRIGQQAADVADIEGEKAAADFRVGEEREAARLEKLIADIEAMKETVTGIEDRASALAKHGYMPLQRFGNRTVTARDAEGKVQFFYTTDGRPLVLGSANQEMYQVAAAVRQLHPEWRVTTGIKAEKAWQMYNGLTLDALENFLDFIDPETKAELERDRTVQEFLKNAVNNRSVLKRLIHRSGMPGFSKDVPRVLASFITSSARNSSGMYHIGAAKSLVEAIPDQYGDVKDEASDLVKYVTEPGEEASKLRGFLFFHFLGGSIASAVVNSTQTVIMTAPHLNKFASLADVVAAVGRAAKVAVQDPAKIEGEKGQFLQKAERTGITAPQQIFHLTATAANNPFSSNRSFRSFMTIWGSLFSTVEVFNRRVAFAAAYDIGNGNGLTGDALYEFAKDAVVETQLIYNKGNKPNLGRGAVGSTVMTFKQYSIGYLELLRRLPPQQQLLMLGILMMAAGGEGLPFAGDIEDLIDTLGQWLGFSTNTGKWTGKVIRNTLGPEFERPILKGLGGMLPLDLHSRLGMENLIPGTAFFKPSEIDKTRDVAEAVGPVGSVLQSLSQSLQLLARGKWDQAAVGAAPKAARDFVNGYHMMTTGESTDRMGRLAMKDVTAGEALGKTVGFNPQRAAVESESKREIIQDRNLRLVRMDEITSDIADAMLRSDLAARKDAIDRLHRWNIDNPEMRIDQRQVMRSVQERIRAARRTSQERFMKSVPKPMKREAIESLK
ncbi:MAG: PLxRFG domain-containing protein [Betaproteobacteria bacterium]|nr:PLxRFG domain-containing protein [Betaproteobacteria bacterium]